MCVDHRSRNVAVTEQRLHRADVGALLEQVGCERVPECMAGHRLRHTGTYRRGVYGALDRLIVEAMPSQPAGRTVENQAHPRKDELPAPSPGGVWEAVLDVHGDLHISMASSDVGIV